VQRRVELTLGTTARVSAQKRREGGPSNLLIGKGLQDPRRPANQKVGSSNLSGRATWTGKGSPARAALFHSPVRRNDRCGAEPTTPWTLSCLPDCANRTYCRRNWPDGA